MTEHGKAAGVGVCGPLCRSLVVPAASTRAAAIAMRVNYRGFQSHVSESLMNFLSFFRSNINIGMNKALVDCPQDGI
jgi:hypothetical protein